jgi:hypothetical protein
MTPMSKPLCKHNLVICRQCVAVTDAARRIFDAINMKVVSKPFDELARSWMAFRLDDGTTDGNLYPSKQSAMDHVSNEFHYVYFFMRGALSGSNPVDCQLWLEFQRHAYDSGHRLSTPNADLIMPLSRGGNQWLNR